MKPVIGNRYTVDRGHIECDADNCGEWHQGGHAFHIGHEELYEGDALLPVQSGDTVYVCSDLDDKIGNYFLLKEAIHQAMGYKPDWVEIPLEDMRGNHWLITNENGGSVAWAPSPFTLELIEAGTLLYNGDLYTQRFLTKYVYRTPTHVMIAVDTHCDGNKFLMIFSAEKECTDPVMIKAYLERWG